LSIKTTQLTLADFNIHLIQDFPHLFLGDPKIFGDLKAHGAGKFAILGFLLNDFFQLLAIHDQPPKRQMSKPKVQINDKIEISENSACFVI
jgi:hypothetical protein